MTEQSREELGVPSNPPRFQQILASHLGVQAVSPPQTTWEPIPSME